MTFLQSTCMGCHPWQRSKGRQVGAGPQAVAAAARRLAAVRQRPPTRCVGT